MSEYGVFASLVGTVASLAAAAGAITLAFTKRARWQPPEEAVPASVARLAALVAMIGIALLYAFASRIGATGLAIVAVAGTTISLIALPILIATNIRYSFYWPRERIEPNRKLGGSELTREAMQISLQHGHGPQRLFEDAQGDKDLVWTRESQASVQIRSAFGFIALISAGTCSLAAAGLLVTVSAAPIG